MTINDIKRMSVDELKMRMPAGIEDRFAFDPDTYEYYTADMAAEDIANMIHDDDCDIDPEQYADEMNMYIVWYRKANGLEV